MNRLRLLSLCLAAASAPLGAQVLELGSQTGAQIFFNDTLVRSYNFGITYAGGSQALTATSIEVNVKGSNSPSHDVIVRVYDGFGGTGSLLATGTILASQLTNQFQFRTVTFDQPLVLDQGSYSVVLTTGSTTNYFIKNGALELQDSGGLRLTNNLWVQDSNTDGTAATSLTAANNVLAEAALGTTSVNFGSFRLGATKTQSVSLSNVALATTNNVTEELSVTSSSANAPASVGGLPAGTLAQGASTNFTVALNTATAGVRNGTVTLNYGSVKGSSASTTTTTTTVGSSTINVTGTGYRAAAAAASQTVNLGNFRVGTGKTASVTLANTATADATYTETLSTSGFSSTTSGFTATGSASGIAGGANGSGTLTVGVGSSVGAGVQSGSTTLALLSNEVNSSGLGSISAGNQVITINGTGYRAAAGSVSSSSVNLGNFRVGATNVTGSTTVSNTATADGYSEGLTLAASGHSGGATASGLSGLVAAGGNKSITVGLSSIAAGANSGSFSLGYTTDGTGTSGLSSAAAGSQQINVSATGYRAATGSFSAPSVDLGKFHVGASGLLGSTTVSNTSSADGYSESLALSSSGTTGGASASNLGNIVAGGSRAVGIGLASVSSVGANTGTVTLALASTGSGTSGLADLSLGTQVVDVTATGYSGQASWNVDANGSWNSFAGWDNDGGKPGVDGALSAQDTATFGGAATAARTISLGEAVPTLRSLSFDNASASYTVAAGGSGRLQLGTSGGNGALSVLSGNHTVSAGVELAQQTAASVAAGSRLLLSGALTGSAALVKQGSGKLEIGGSGDFSGITTVEAGLLTVNGSIAASEVNVASGGTLGGSGTVGGTTIETGGTLAPGNSPGTLSVNGDLTWAPGGNYNWQIVNAGGTEGSGWDLVDISGDLDLTFLSAETPFAINLWTLSSTGPDVNGAAINFNNQQSYTWTIARVAGAIVGFSASLFDLNLTANNGTSGWANDLGGGSIAIVQDGQDLNLVFTAAASPIPEPSTYGLLLGAGALALAAARRRRKA